MAVLFIFTCILSCISLRLLWYFFEKGCTILQLLFTIALLAVTGILVGYLSKTIYVPILDQFIIK